MTTKHKERLKDIIIDHIYHYCFNELVKKLEGNGLKMELDEGSKIEDDPTLRSIYNEIIKANAGIKFSYGTRGGTYCKVIEGNSVNSSFMNILISQGFKKSNKLEHRINEALSTLLNKSYIATNQPVKTEVTLTPKGINHYTSGKSFEDEYTKGRNARIALVISIVSITMAVLSLVTNLMKKSI